MEVRLDLDRVKRKGFSESSFAREVGEASFVK
jgi:hypothetical protein